MDLTTELKNYVKELGRNFTALKKEDSAEARKVIRKTQKRLLKNIKEIVEDIEKQINI